jgi:Protein of unknown function (DUF3297)
VNEAKSPPPVPDRLSTDPRSPHHVAAVFEHEIGIRLNDKERFDVSEYCISEGWVKVPSGKTVDRKGQPLLITLKGRVEAFYRAANDVAAPRPPSGAQVPPGGTARARRWGQGSGR